jgi:hypothetical protein
MILAIGIVVVLILLALLTLKAAPPTTARSDPSSATVIKLLDGFSSTIGCAANTALKFWEITPKPPGIDGGDKINTTTMLNTAWRTFVPRHLKTLTTMTIQAAYDPDVFNQIYAVINTTTGWTFHFPDGSTLDFWGALTKFEPGEMKEGEMPVATITIEPGNYDNVNRVEAAPVLTSVSGT